jgi:polyisoprenoid-binding protein YceI
MKSRFIVKLLLALAMLAPMQLLAANYVIDKEGQHAAVLFKASHLGFSYNVGRFKSLEGKFSYDKNKASASTASVTIDAKSVDSNHAERDKHLRSDDFLDVAKYPTITFSSTGYQAGSENDTLKGKLTLHGVTKEVEIAVNHIGEGKDPWGGYRSGFEGRLAIEASDYGMPEWVGTIIIELNVEGIRQ